MTLKRNYPSGFTKRKKKQRVEKLVECQRGAIDKFFTSDKQIEQSVEDLNSEEFETLVNNENENLVDNENENLVDEEGNGEFGSAEANQDDEMNTKFERGPVRRNCEFKLKKQFDENVSGEVTQSAEESFRVGYFLYFVDQALCSLKNRFEQFKVYEANFGFLFDLKKCSDESLKAGCVNFEEFLKHGEIFDIDGRDLLMELKVLKERLPKEVNKPIEVLNHLQLMANCFPNSWVAYRILLTIPDRAWSTCGRYFSFNQIVNTEEEAVKLAESLSPLISLPPRYECQGSEVYDERLKNKKLNKLVDSTAN
ncbi:hypothetical protein ACSBR1_022861 [Camellia fascicularis]